MEQRRLRLGDIIDDYCPRERRLSNHVIVAIIDDEVKQTRCTTCDADHPYKGARVPPKRKKIEAPAALYKQVLDNMQDRPAPEGDADATVTPGAVLRPAAPRSSQRRSAAASLAAESHADVEPAEPGPVPPVAAADTPPVQDDEEGPVHRPLIRATLPRPEGQVPERKAPDFTLRLPGARLGPFRDGDLKGPRAPTRPGGKSARPPAKGGRPGGPKPGRPAPNGNRASAFAHGSPGHRPFGTHGPRPHGRPGGGKKRSR
jgi:translation initiation factor IF-2